MTINPILLFGSQTGAVGSFTFFPQWVELGVTSLWLEPDIGTNVAPVPGSQLIALMTAFSAFGGVPGISDSNANAWNTLQLYPVNGQGIGAFSAIANSSVAPDTINFATGAWGANACYLVLDIDASIGSFTTAFATSAGGSISATTASGYTLTLPCSGDSQLLILEWGGGVAGQTYRLAWLLGQENNTTGQAGWTRVDNLYTYPGDGFLLGRGLWVYNDLVSTGNIVVKKATAPPGSPQSFTFTPSYGAPFSLTDGQSNDSGQLEAGTYSVAETPMADWTTTVSQDPTAIVLGHGKTVTVTFTNSKIPPCAPLNVLGAPVNGVFVDDLSLFIIPATALYDSLTPNSQLQLSETANQGRREIIVNFNGSEGMWKRDLGTIFTWPLKSKTALYVWQPSIIPFPMGDDVYYRLSFHALMSSLGMVGWAHVREMNIAHLSTGNLTLLLSFDQGPPISLTIPNSGGLYAKTKVTIPANKSKMVEVLISSATPFKLFGSDLEMKCRQWGSTEAYRVLKPVVD